MKQIQFIIPLLNEAKNIPLIYDAIRREITKNNIDIRITYIDDGSIDESWDQICQLSASDIRVKGIRFSRNFGKEYAIEAGLRQSKADAAIVLDADLQHPIALIPEMIEAWLNEGFKVVSGIKSQRQKESVFRSVVSSSYYYIFNRMSGLQLQQMTDFKLLDKEVIESYLALPEGSRFFRGLIAWLGYKEKLIEFSPLDRLHGETAWSFRQLVNYAKGTLISFSYVPLKLISFMSFAMFLFALLLGLQSIYNKLLGNAEEGFTTVLITQLIIGCAIMYGLSNIGTYIAKIYDELKSRPHYIISEETRE
ncbi:hypothetical protein CBP51_12110 [Cellvibrio mixtus]|uniref:Glycosyltransferase 2-like domain-containing protein n=1 Tax=Cellvibrio mixtus TaxID=39650 RepID=A0A266QE96_9GAMM|nr:glycosyltransferase family 2 protein [Cellvibrio mixtus]OZY87671.1 hypothetical protein CBP51_12110 [Cellvibrio mixtus]